MVCTDLFTLKLAYLGSSNKRFRPNAFNMPSARFNRKSQKAFILTSEDGWAIRHLNPDLHDPRLKRFHLDDPGWSRSNDGKIDMNLEHRYSNPELFIKQHKSDFSPAQIERLQSIHKTLVLSTRLWDTRGKAKSELKITKILAPLAPTLVTIPAAFDSFLRFKKNQTERKAAREELGKHILDLKDGEATAVYVQSGKDHAVGACIQKLSSNNRDCRLAIESFDGKSRSQKIVVSFPDDVLTKQKGVRANGLHAFEDYFAGNKEKNTETLNQFLKNIGATLHSTQISTSQQGQQNMGNCFVRNPEYALFCAIERDQSLGQGINLKFQGFLREKAIAVIQQSQAFTESEKMALPGLNAVNNDTKSRLERSKLQTSTQALKKPATLGGPFDTPSEVPYVIAGNDQTRQINDDARYAQELHAKYNGNMSANDVWKRVINKAALPISQAEVPQKKTPTMQRALDGLKASNGSSAYQKKPQGRFPIPQTSSTTTKTREAR